MLRSPLLVLLFIAPAFLAPPSTSQELEVRGQRTARDTRQDAIKVVISEGCAQGDSSDGGQGGKEIDLAPGSPLVLTHKIKLVPSGSGSGSGSCGCEADFAALRERLERLEREVSALREKCGGADGSCCTSKESKGAGCSINNIEECPNECSDQGRCVDGKCVCFPGFSGLDCSESNCPRNCNDKGRCVNGQCVCDPGFSGPDCSQKACPDNCNNRGRCVNGRCVCDSGFTGPSCSDQACPRNCNNRGRCVNGQCVCKTGFSGPDCSTRGCPDNCSDHGRCVNGKCVCESGYTGTDCSEIACPGNCNNQGRCINGECVCDEGFGGPDCLEVVCPNDCYDRGRCVNGKCICDSGFTGEDCSETACPGNCNNRGRCVSGQCVCDEGFTGDDCSENACPGNCNNRGRCINGQCVCNEGFTGDDCSENACPGNCNNRGRCVNGQCVCDEGFTGDDCSENSCPGNCNNRGRCVNGQCVCDEGFTGDDCSENACPGNCNNRGRCINGQCVCDEGFTGDDCSENACPGNCNNRGRCVNGQCVCDDGFTGDDCSEKACPNNCSNRGKCVNGKCVCDVGFAGPDCAAKGCPSNCNNKGRCVKGRCICRRGFTGPDCSQCEEGKTGPNCDTVMSGVSALKTRDVTETSVTLLWTPPPIQYDAYYITFSSQKESDQQITVQVEGSLTTYTQTGLAAGQEYSVSIAGEINGKRGTESTAEFTTLISGPTNLHVVKTTSTSAVVQWEQSQGEIDRYRLTVVPNDGVGRSQEMTVPAGQSSAHIQQLEAGRLYDITLVAEKGTSHSKPATTQVTPGKSTVPTAALTMKVTSAPGQDVPDRDQEVDPSSKVKVIDYPKQKGDGSEAVNTGEIDGSNKGSSATLIVKPKPVVNRRVTTDGKVINRPALPKKPNVSGPFRFNATRVPGVKKLGPGPFKKSPVKVVPKKLKPGVPTIGNRTSSERLDAKNPAILSGTDSDRNRQSRPEEQTIGFKEQPDVGTGGSGNDTALVSPEPTGTVQGQGSKCMNKIKVTHVRFPLKDRGNGCRGDGTGVGVKTSQQDSSETDDSPDSNLSSSETDLDYSPDPLHKLLSDTFDRLNITTFSVHLSKSSNLPTDADRVRMQILGGLVPLSSPPSESSATLSSSSLSPTPEPSSLPSKLLPSSPPPSSSSSSDESISVGSNEPQIDGGKNTTDISSPEDKKQPTMGKGAVPFFRRTPAKYGYIRRLRPNLGPSQNKTNGNMRAPNLNHIPGREMESRQTSTSELLSSPSASASDESTVETPVGDTGGEKEGAVIPASFGVEQNGKKIQTERGRFPVRRVSLRTGNVHRPPSNFGPLRNRTRPNARLLPPPSQPLNPALETSKEQVSSIALPTTSSIPVSKESHAVEGEQPKGEESENGVGSSVSTEFNQTLRESGLPSSHRPTTRVGFFRRPQLFDGRFTNRTNLRPPQHPHRGPIHKPYPARKINGGSKLIVGGQLEKISTPKSPNKQPREQGALLPTQGVQSRQSGEQDAPMRTQGVQSRQSGEQDASMPTQGFQSRQPGEQDASMPTQGVKGRQSGEQGAPMPTQGVHTRQSGEQGAPMPTQGIHTRQSGKQGAPMPTQRVQTRQSGEQDASMPTQGVQGRQSGEQDASMPTQGVQGRQSGDQGSPMPTQGVHTRQSGEQRAPMPTQGVHIRQSGEQGAPMPTQGVHTRQSGKQGASLPPQDVQTRQSGEQDASMPSEGIQTTQSGEQGSSMTSQGVQNRHLGGTGKVTPTVPTNDFESTIRQHINELEGGGNTPVQTANTGEEERRTPDSNADPDTQNERVGAGKIAGSVSRARPNAKQTTLGSRPVPHPKRPPPPRGPQVRHYISGSQRRVNTKTDDAAKEFDHKTEDTRHVDSKPMTGSDISSSGVVREPLDNVEVTNRTSDGFTLTWDSPEGKYKNFVVTRKEVRKHKGPKEKGIKTDQEGEDTEKEGHHEANTKGHVSSDNENKVPESFLTKDPQIQSSTTAKPVTENDETLKKVLSGSARSFQFENLSRQTEYTVTLLGKGPGLLSRLHKLVISTGPEPPTDIIFSELTENSLTVSWTKPKSAVSGFKVTYTHKDDGEPVSVSVDSDDSTLGLSQLSPGSSYEVSVISILGLDESDPIRDSVMTLPDPPTDLRAVNITDSKALLLWRPALAAVDKYSIVYGAGTASELRVSVSGNAAEQQLVSLEGSTTYTVTISSQLGSLQSSPTSTTFTTTSTRSSGDGDVARDLRATRVTPRTALLSWQPPLNRVGGYRLTYQTEGQEMKEVIVGASVTEYNLTRLYPGSKYTVQLQAEAGGQYTSAISTEFTTGTLRFPFPTDCSQELLNGILTSSEVEIFPQGKHGKSMMVYCDMETDGGGWTVFQRRKDGSVDFFRGWRDYMKGFGDVNGEFWLGLDNLHNLTAMTRMSLRVDMRDQDESVYAKYSTFEVSKRNYRLTVGGYSGTAGDSLTYHNNRVFSTRDRDPAPFITRCAMSYRGGWWYKNCHEANLNGLYGIDVKHQGVIWTSWKGKEYSIPFTEMKMRPTSFSPPTSG